MLQKFNISDASIASLTSKPAKLICHLYEHYGAREPGTAHQPPGTGTDKGCSKMDRVGIKFGLDMS